jgi:hypothetical protein
MQVERRHRGRTLTSWRKPDKRVSETERSKRRCSETTNIRHMKSVQRIGMMILAGAALTTTSCSTGGRSPSGFLSNYQQLDAGYGTADALSAYVKPGADLKKYNSVIIDPVTTVVASPSVTPAVKDQLAAYLGESLRSQLSGKMQIVGAPGPNTLRIRTALTDVVENQSSGRPVTIVHANPQATLSGKLGSEETAAFVSSVSFEGEIVDSTSGERLAALSDHRLGAKRKATPATSWAAVRSATNQGALRLWERFSAARGQ